VTFLSILGAHSIALPLSPSFPAHELQYIMDQSQALMLLTSTKFESKAQEIFKEGLEGNPKLVKVEKKLGGAKATKVTLEESSDDRGGMMLYTSGTTNRPVSFLLIPLKIVTEPTFSERSSPSRVSYDSTIEVTYYSLELFLRRPFTSRSPAPSHSRHYKCSPNASFRWFCYGIPLSI
jgi:acyl-CoA synthetase (AMP-forming)/AMP-acid ligase II